VPKRNLKVNSSRLKQSSSAHKTYQKVTDFYLQHWEKVTGVIPYQNDDCPFPVLDSETVENADFL
jgi:hypothetical protein